MHTFFLARLCLSHLNQSPPLPKGSALRRWFRTMSLQTSQRYSVHSATCPISFCFTKQVISSEFYLFPCLCMFSMYIDHKFPYVQNIVSFNKMPFKMLHGKKNNNNYVIEKRHKRKKNQHFKNLLSILESVYISLRMKLLSFPLECDLTSWKNFISMSLSPAPCRWGCIKMSLRWQNDSNSNRGKPGEETQLSQSHSALHTNTSGREWRSRLQPPQRRRGAQRSSVHYHMKGR